MGKEKVKEIKRRAKGEGEGLGLGCWLDWIREGGRAWVWAAGWVG